MTSRRVFGAALALLLGLALVPAAMADDNTTVTITDSGFTPTTLSVAPGTTVTFINKGSAVHSATSTDKLQAFDTGGLGPGQSGTAFLNKLGTFAYSSQPDCLNGNSNPTFICGAYTIVVGSPAPQTSVVPTPTATPAPNATIQQNATIQISDSGFSPANVAIVPGGIVTWTNMGTMIHTATSGAGAPLPFDSGGLAPGQSSSKQLDTPGTYLYSSDTDCRNGNNNPAFNCAASYTVTVQAAAVGSTTTNPGAPFSGPNLMIRDDGFQPQTIDAQAGQTVTWLNVSTKSHSVTSVPGSGPSYDSGGLADGDSFSFVFNQPGTYNFYSKTDQPAGTTGPQPDSPFSGTVVVH